MSKKFIIITVIVIIVLVLIGYWGFIKKEAPVFTLEKVLRGTISQEISETGIVKASDEINLGFKSTGIVEEIYVKVGDSVEIGQSLVKLNVSQLIIQLNEAQAALGVAQAQLNKLLAGSSPEEIKISETSVSNAEIAYNNAEQNLEDVRIDAQEDLNSAYEDALNVLNDSELEIYNAFNTVDSIQRTYFFGNDQGSIKVKESKNEINTNISQVEPYLDAVEADPENENIDTALSEIKTALENTSDALKVVREMCGEPAYYYIVSSTDKTSLDTQRADINTALTNVIDSQQTISSTRITNESNINTAQAEASTAEGSLRKAEDELALKKAGPRQEDIDLEQAKVTQARTKVTLLQDQIQEFTLKSSIVGRVTDIDKKVGETIQPTESMISLISADLFQVKVDIYEEDIVKVKINNQVDISLAAFPDEVLKGKVVSINPTEKVIDGVVYYEVTISPDGQWPIEVKPGMTADIVIKADSRENVLIIPEEAVQKYNGKVTVQVFKNGEIEEREIEIGLEGSNYDVEVVSGLKEGEEIVIK